MLIGLVNSHKDLKVIFLLAQINEAFAPQTIACQRALDINPDLLNMSGGAIAIGHPLAASGSRITSHIVHYLR